MGDLFSGYLSRPPCRYVLGRGFFGVLVQHMDTHKSSAVDQSAKKTHSSHTAVMAVKRVSSLELSCLFVVAWYVTRSSTALPVLPVVIGVVAGVVIGRFSIKPTRSHQVGARMDEKRRVP